MIALVRRAEPSAFWTYAAPVLAVLLTMVVGAGLFAGATEGFDFGKPTF